VRHSNQVFVFPLHINYDDFLPYYRGQITKIEVVDTTGRKLWIGARHFRTFFTAAGIKSYFEMEIDAQGNLIRLSKI